MTKKDFICKFVLNEIHTPNRPLNIVLEDAEFAYQKITDICPEKPPRTRTKEHPELLPGVGKLAIYRENHKSVGIILSYGRDSAPYAVVYPDGTNFPHTECYKLLNDLEKDFIVLY